MGKAKKPFNAKIVGTDPYNDIALLKAERGEFTPIEMGDSEKLNVGQYVLALANPFNRNQPTATSGMVTSVNSTIRGWRGATAMENVIATDAQLNPGFSGGPLVDVEGKLIGINTAYVWQRGIAIPVNKVKAITDRLMTGKTAQRGYLGIIANTVGIPEEIAEQAGLEQETGVMIFSVEAGSPARKAGLAMGDVLVKFNGKPVTDFYDLPRLLAEDVIDKETKLTIIRRETLLEATIIPTSPRRRRRLINKMPVELEPPSPMPAPPLRRRPSITPQFSSAINTGPSILPSDLRLRTTLFLFIILLSFFFEA